MNDNATLSLIAALDQQGAMAAGTAEIMGQYRRKLEESGVPEDEAMILLRDWHWMWWIKMLWNEAEPPEMPY